MPGLQGESVSGTLGSPVKKSKLSLKFLQKKETKRALDFSEPQADEPKTFEPVEPEARWVLCCQCVIYLGSQEVQNTALVPNLTLSRSGEPACHVSGKGVTKSISNNS